MKFTVSGLSRPRIGIGSRQGEITWNDGKMEGDDFLVQSCRQEALLLVGERIGPHEGPYTRNRHLAEPTSACIIMVSLFVPNTVTFTGDIPERPALPEGAIG
jgi:hypothetical protein